jgi:hypothetical protein
VTPEHGLLQALEKGSDNYSLGAIVEKTDGKDCRLLTKISEAEYEDISAALTALTRLKPPFHYGLVERNYRDLQAVYQFVTITLSLGREFATPDRIELVASLATSIVNWLTAMRLFLDHEETDLKRRFGKQSPEVEAFKAATAAAFDADDPGYRFASKFRNYVQHCGVPLSRLDLVRPPGSNLRAKQSIRLLVDRDDLLAKFDEWGLVKKDLLAFPPTFELLPLIASAMNGIRDVHKACAEIDLDHALAQSAVLARALDCIESAGPEGEPAVFRYRRVTNTYMDISPRLIPSDAIRTLQSVARGDTSRDSLWSATKDSPTLPLDPTTIREWFHRDSRGVQALTVWMSDGDGKPRFAAAVNKFIAEDGSIEPLITGLTNVSTLLAGIAAAALGTSPEGLVGGLLDIYGPFDQPIPEAATSKEAGSSNRG